jgi:hypothetical protein
MPNEKSHIRWDEKRLEDKLIVLRDDGYTQFCQYDDMTKDILEKTCVDYLKETKVQIKEWGLGPGSVLTYDTKAGEVFGAALSTKELDTFRQIDRRAYRNIKTMIDKGDDPLKVVINRAHEIGLKVWARLEMNHEFGPPDPDNWLWTAFVGAFNKNHPEYRIPGSVRLDFKFKEVRDYRLGVLKETADAGVDGVSMDFAVYPPFLSDPKADKRIMTQFVGDVRNMLDKAGKEQGRRIDLIVRLPYECEDIGIDWKTWVDMGIVDVIIPTVVNLADAFDVPVDEFVEYTRNTKCRIFGCIRPYMGYIETDEVPEDDDTGAVRIDREMTNELFYARAMLLLGAGVDGIQLATGSGDLIPEDASWRQKADAWKGVYNDLGSPTFLMYKDKDYVVNRKGQLPMRFEYSGCYRQVIVRIADDIEKLLFEKHDIKAKIVLFSKELKENESLQFQINGNEMMEIKKFGADDHKEDAPVDISSVKNDISSHNEISKDPQWWKKGMHEITVPAKWFMIGENNIKVTYNSSSCDKSCSYKITDMNIRIEFGR